VRIDGANATYRAQRLNVTTGETASVATVSSSGGRLELKSPRFSDAIALRLERVSGQ
jgi:hypothetical protein